MAYQDFSSFKYSVTKERERENEYYCLQQGMQEHDRNISLYGNREGYK